MDFVCPKCGSRSFMVVPGEPMQVECLKCGTVVRLVARFEVTGLQLALLRPAGSADLSPLSRVRPDVGPPAAPGQSLTRSGSPAR